MAVTGNPNGKLDLDVLGIVACFHLPVPTSRNEIEKAADYRRLHRGGHERKGSTSGGEGNGGAIGRQGAGRLTCMPLLRHHAWEVGR